MNIRAANHSDVAAITDIYNYYVLNSVATFDEVPISVDEMQQRINSVTTNNLPWLVAESDDGIVGFAYATKWKERSAYRHTAEVTIYLHHEAIRQGVGMRLYTELFSELKDKDITTIVGGIALPNPASVALHERLGMEKVAHFLHVGYKFETWVDVAYWQIQLNDKSVIKPVNRKTTIPII